MQKNTTRKKTSESRFAQTFVFQNSKKHEIRTVIKDDGSVWFVAADICKILSIKNITQAVNSLDNDEKDNTLCITEGNQRGNPNVNIINESGLYYLIFKSRKPGAIKFRKWVTNEVLPQIRKTGSYCYGQNPDEEDTLSPEMTLKQVIGFLQTTTDAYWQVNKIVDQLSVVAGETKKAKKAITAIMDSIKEISPDAREMFDEIAGRSLKSVIGGEKGPLEVEMYGR